MTRDLYSRVAAKWAVLGFSRRFIPIYYEYTLETRQKIQKSISNGHTTLLQLMPLDLKVPDRPVDTSIGKFAMQIQGISDELATNIGYIPKYSKKNAVGKNAAFIGKQLEFTPHLSLRSLARAHALRAGRKSVDESDMKFLMDLIMYTRYDRPGTL